MPPLVSFLSYCSGNKTKELARYHILSFSGSKLDPAERLESLAIEGTGTMTTGSGFL